MTPTGTATRPRPADDVDESSERWVTAVHEEAHALIAEQVGAKVSSCRVTGDATGNTRHNAEGANHAIVAVAGERAARLLCGSGGGSSVDYEQAEGALAGTGHDIAWAEQRADDLIRRSQREIRRNARTLYHRGYR